VILRANAAAVKSNPIENDYLRRESPTKKQINSLVEILRRHWLTLIMGRMSAYAAWALKLEWVTKVFRLNLRR